MRRLYPEILMKNQHLINLFLHVTVATNVKGKPTYHNDGGVWDQSGLLRKLGEEEEVGV